MQTTLFGKFGVAKPKTYYNHDASTPFEKVIEAFYFFNKSKKSKENCYKEGVQLWKDLKKKGNEERLRDYLKLHGKAIEKREKQAATKFNSQSKTYASHACSSQSLSSSLSSSSFLSFGEPTAPKNVQAESPMEAVPHSREEIIVRAFLDELGDGMSSFFEDIENERLVCFSLFSLAKSINGISKLKKFIEDQKVRKKETTLTQNLKHIDARLSEMKKLIKQCQGIEINPKIGIFILQGNLAKKK